MSPRAVGSGGAIYWRVSAKTCSLIYGWALLVFHMTLPNDLIKRQSGLTNLLWDYSFTDNYYFFKAFNSQGWKWFGSLTSIENGGSNPIFFCRLKVYSLIFPEQLTWSNESYLAITYKFCISECFFKTYSMLLLLHRSYKKFHSYFFFGALTWRIKWNS